MLTKEQTALISALSDYIYKRQTVLPDDIDKDSFVSLARSQGLSAILYYQTRLQELFSDYNHCMYSYIQQTALISHISKAFNDASIPFLIFKGPQIAKFYYHPQLRFMGDVDFLVHKEDKQKADDILLSLGFKYIPGPFKQKPDDHEWLYSKDNFEIELHHRLLYDDVMNVKDHIAFTDKAWDFTEKANNSSYRLDLSFHFIYILLHLLKHILYSGVTVRRIFDLAILIKNADLDWVYIEKALSDLNLLSFAKHCFALVDMWFGVTAPISFTPCDEAFYQYVCSLVFASKRSDEEMESHLDHNSQINWFRKNNVSSDNPLKALWLYIFPKYESFKAYYPFLNCLGFFGYFFIPFLWVYRVIKFLCKKSFAGVIAKFTQPFRLKNDLKAHEEILKMWGL